MSLIKEVKKELSKRGRADLKMKIGEVYSELDDLSVENVVEYLLVKYPEKKIYTKNIIKSKDAKFYHS